MDAVKWMKKALKLAVTGMCSFCLTPSESLDILSEVKHISKGIPLYCLLEAAKEVLFE